MRKFFYQVILIIFSVLLGALGESYLHKIKSEKDYIQTQLFEFYYPLKNILHDSTQYWLDYKNQKNQFKSLDEWQRQMEVVFKSKHDQMAYIINQKRHYGIQSDEINKQLDLLMKHISHYKIIVSKWKDNKKSGMYASVAFPKRLESILDHDINILRSELDN